MRGVLFLHTGFETCFPRCVRSWVPVTVFPRQFHLGGNQGCVFVPLPPKFNEKTSQEREEKNENGGWEREKKKSEILGPPHPSGPTPTGPHPTGPHRPGHHFSEQVRAAPFGAHATMIHTGSRNGLGQNWCLPKLAGPTTMDGQKWIGPNLDWPKLAKSGWPKRDWPKSVSSHLKPSNPQTLKPSNPQTLKPSNPQTFKPES